MKNSSQGTTQTSQRADGAFELLSGYKRREPSSRRTRGLTEQALLNHLSFRYGCKAEPLRDHLKANPLIEVEVAGNSEYAQSVRWNPQGVSV